jgi:hypothetical protein
MNGLRLIFMILAIVYSVVWIGVYWAGKTERPVPMKYHSTPIETTTAEERARGEGSFEIARAHQFGITRAGFFGLVTIGYVVLLVAFAIASLVLRLSPT